MVTVWNYFEIQGTRKCMEDEVAKRSAKNPGLKNGKKSIHIWVYRLRWLSITSTITPQSQNFSNNKLRKIRVRVDNRCYKLPQNRFWKNLGVEIWPKNQEPNANMQFFLLSFFFFFFAFLSFRSLSFWTTSLFSSNLW